MYGNGELLNFYNSPEACWIKFELCNVRCRFANGVESSMRDNQLRCQFEVQKLVDENNQGVRRMTYPVGKPGRTCGMPFRDPR